MKLNEFIAVAAISSALTGAGVVAGYNPPPTAAPCEASKDVKEMVKSQQSTVTELTDMLKKSMDNLAAACKK